MKLKLEEKLYIEMVEQNLFNKDFGYVKNKLSKFFGVKAKDIETTLKNLEKQEKIFVDNGKIVLKKVKEELQDKTEDENDLLDNQILGTVVKNESGVMFVKLNSNKLPLCEIEQNEIAKKALGKTCLVKIKKQDKKVTGKILDVFGAVNDPISQNVAIAKKYGFTNKFPSKVIKEAQNIPQYVTDEQREGRVNLEHLPFLTIDPEGCKDKDDAIFDEELENGFKTYIAIADVSSGVEFGSELDKEAFKRGNSCYLGNGVYPMLPPELSNGIFSLDENKPRLALVVSCIVTNGLKIKEPKIELAVINVKKSYSYDEAEKTHLSQDDYEVKNAQTKDQIDLLYKNTKLLEKMFSGALEFESHEPQYIFSKDGKSVVDIKSAEEGYSHKVVETRMILANKIVAKLFKDRGLVGLFRTHEPANAKEINNYIALLRAFNIDYELHNTTESYRGLLKKIKGHYAKDFLMVEAIKTLAHAQYTATRNQVEHFGLNIKNTDWGYMHFTSPIRRYADLVTHRMIKDILLKKGCLYDIDNLEFIAEQLNKQEVKADCAEEESNKFLNCLWASKQKNKIFDGYISGFTRNCIKVTTKNGLVNMYIPIEKLSDNKQSYKLSDDGFMLKYGNTKFILSDKISFAIEDVDLQTCSITAKYIDKKLLKNDDMILQK